MRPQSVNRKLSNGVRSGIVVVVALAFGYLTLKIGLKPYLEKAAQQQHALDLHSHADPSSTSQTQSKDDGFSSSDS